MKNTTFMKAAVAAALTVGFAGQAFAAGYEKSIMWGGRTGSVAGISTSYIMGADALYFNPAGLVAAAPGNEVSLNVSPVWSRFEGPYNNQNEIAKSETGFSTPIGAIYSNTLNDSWAFGVGGYISGGSKVKYNDVKFNSPFANSTADAETDLQIGEISAGVAYKINPMWKIGASYRYVMAKAAFSLIQRPTTTSLVNVMLKDLEDETSAFKLGTQWSPSESTHVGLTYRSEAKLDAKGRATAQGYVAPNGDPTNSALLTGDRGEVTAATVFPQAVTLGADHAFNETWVGYGEVAWTNYAKVEKITISGPILNSQVTQDWKDQWNARVGAEYKGFSWPVRFGYGFTSQVTNDAWARPTFTPPGASHTLTAGSGQNFELWGQKLAFNGAAEYTFVSGDGTGRAANDGSTSGAGDESANIRAGTHKTNSYALHLGLAYNF